MDRDPLKDNDEITELKEWLERAGINSVYDLSKWDSHDDWKGWDFYEVPDRLKQGGTLEELLEDAAPVNRTSKDSWGWGRSGNYTISESSRK
jgi:hypothetical protein